MRRRRRRRRLGAIHATRGGGPHLVREGAPAGTQRLRLPLAAQLAAEVGVRARGRRDVLRGRRERGGDGKGAAPRREHRRRGQPEKVQVGGAGGREDDGGVGEPPPQLLAQREAHPLRLAHVGLVQRAVGKAGAAEGGERAAAVEDLDQGGRRLEEANRGGERARVDGLAQVQKVAQPVVHHAVPRRLEGHAQQRRAARLLRPAEQRLAQVDVHLGHRQPERLVRVDRPPKARRVVGLLARGRARIVRGAARSKRTARLEQRGHALRVSERDALAPARSAQEVAQEGAGLRLEAQLLRLVRLDRRAQQPKVPRVDGVAEADRRSVDAAHENGTGRRRQRGTRSARGATAVLAAAGRRAAGVAGRYERIGRLRGREARQPRLTCKRRHRTAQATRRRATLTDETARTRRERPQESDDASDFFCMQTYTWLSCRTTALHGAALATALAKAPPPVPALRTHARERGTRRRQRHALALALRQELR